jgi:hypothetical protein
MSDRYIATDGRQGFLVIDGRLGSDEEFSLAWADETCEPRMMARRELIRLHASLESETETILGPISGLRQL